MKKKLTLTNKLYDFLKWFLIIAVPAFITLFTTLAMTWHWDIPVEAIVTTISAIAACLGALIGISTVNYNKEKNNAN